MTTLISSSLTLLRSKLTAGMLALGIVAGLGGAAAHASPGPAARGDGKGKVARVCDRVECSDDQRAQIKQILNDRKSAHMADRAKARQLTAQLSAERSKPAPNEAELSRLHAQLSALRDANRARMRETAAQLREVLTPEQQAKVAQARERRGDRSGAKGRGHGRGHGPKAKGRGGPKGHKADKRGGPDKRDLAKRGGPKSHERGNGVAKRGGPKGHERGEGIAKRGGPTRAKADKRGAQNPRAMAKRGGPKADKRGGPSGFKANKRGAQNQRAMAGRGHKRGPGGRGQAA
ncbi:MAG: periplasmic heavy metal sensor [Myxococcales bacterium]|nr:periplasmic heavy metal sensor [Myxococcales bacterium]